MTAEQSSTSVQEPRGLEPDHPDRRGEGQQPFGRLVRGRSRRRSMGCWTPRPRSCARRSGTSGRRPARTARAGFYQRKLQTKAGEVQLKVPKLRQATFETAIIERYRRRESSMEEALIEMYLAGVSVRRVEDITEASVGHAGQCRHGQRAEPEDLRADRAVAERADRRRTPVRVPRRDLAEAELGGRGAERGGAGGDRRGTDGYREILGVAEGTKEDTESWRQFLTHLKDRGLTGVQLIISDKCLGLVEAAAEFYPEARWQRCVVHWYRNVFTEVPSTKVKEVAAMLKAIHAQEDAGRPRPRPRPWWRSWSHEAREGRRDGAGGRGRDAHLLPLPARASAPDPHEQPAGADHAGDPPADAGGGRLPGRPLGVDAGGGSAASRRRHPLGHAALPGHEPFQGAGRDRDQQAADNAIA